MQHAQGPTQTALLTPEPVTRTLHNYAVLETWEVVHWIRAETSNIFRLVSYVQAKLIHLGRCAKLS